jgi:hypothetical protein
MNYSSRRHYAETFSPRFRVHLRHWPISAGKLVSLIDLGWSDNRIACYFGVEPVKVSALAPITDWLTIPETPGFGR